MKKNKPYLYISISSIALVIVLAIQVNWLIETARIKEEIFNEKANMVLSKTTDELCSDQAMCSRIGTCMDEEEGSNHLNAVLNKNDVDKIDSLFKKHMKFYNLGLACKFVIEQHQTEHTAQHTGYMSNTFYKNLDETDNLKGLKLKLIIPDKRQFILQEMGPMFFSSVVLILVVLAMFWRTTLSLLKEKRIAEQTTDFLNNMTHEFKTPLANIALATKLIRKKEIIGDVQKVQGYTEMITAENDKLIHQVEQVLSMTALERGENPLHLEQVNLHDTILAVLKSMSLQIEQKGGRVITNFMANNPYTMADKTHLYNAINNIVDNAIKYANEKLIIHITTSNIEQDLVLSIRDEGIGIDEEAQTKVFDKFYRVPTGNIHNVKGFGLGLSYVKRIVDLHKASISINSKTGKGTEFILTFKHA